MATKRTKTDINDYGMERIPAELNVQRLSFPELQAEVAKSRILEATYNHLRDTTGLPASDISFDLSFGLSW